jgi:hypothetical protein
MKTKNTAHVLLTTLTLPQGQILATAGTPARFFEIGPVTQRISQQNLGNMSGYGEVINEPQIKYRIKEVSPPTGGNFMPIRPMAVGSDHYEIFSTTSRRNADGSWAA